MTRFAGVTPATATLDSGNGYFTKANYTVTSIKDGDNASTQTLSSSRNGWYWGNLIIGGLVGMLIVDPISGAMYQIDTQTGTLNMTRTDGSASIATASLKGDGGTDFPERLMKIKVLREEGVLTEAEYQAKKRAILKDM